MLAEQIKIAQRTMIYPFSKYPTFAAQGVRCTLGGRRLWRSESYPRLAAGGDVQGTRGTSAL